MSSIKKSQKPKIKLLSHQKEPIEYIVAKARDQHGLLINASQGSGKTITALFAAKNYPKCKVIVICPKGLENIWIYNAKKINLYIDLFLDYNNLEMSLFKYADTIKNSFLIIDEAHNLIKIINKLLTHPLEREGGPLEEKTHRIDYKTGELVIPKKRDINIQERQKVVDFINIYKTAKKVLLLTGTPVLNELSDVRWLINIAAGKNVVPLAEADFIREYYKVDALKAMFKGWVNKIIFAEILGYKILPDDYRVNLMNVSHYESQINNALKLYYGFAGIKMIHNKLKSGVALTLKGDLLPIFIIGILTKGISLFINFISSYYSDNYGYDVLDTRALLESKANNYLSFYTFSNTGSKDYPKFSVENKLVEYTEYQLNLWIRLIYGIRLTAQEAVALEMNRNIDEAEIFKPNAITESLYNNKGRIIGNLSSEDSEPIKFKKITDMYLQGKKPSTIVYSSFYERGILLFSDYLKERNVEHTIYTPFLSIDKRNEIIHDFYLKKIKLLLLHPAFFEGFSIQGCRVFHILEPVTEYYIKQQLHYRVIRYQSHAHLPASQRHVKIIQWGCTLTHVFDRIRQQREKLEDWFDNEFILIYFARFSKFSEYLSPDDILIKKIDKVAKKMQEFGRTVQNVSIEQRKSKKELPLKCCIFGVSDTECPKHLPKCYNLKDNIPKYSKPISYVKRTSPMKFKRMKSPVKPKRVLPRMSKENLLKSLKALTDLEKKIIKKSKKVIKKYKK